MFQIKGQNGWSRCHTNSSRATSALPWTHSKYPHYRMYGQMLKHVCMREEGCLHTHVCEIVHAWQPECAYAYAMCVCTCMYVNVHV